MNTVEKGEKLEKEVFEVFKKELTQGRLGLNENHAKVFLKKGYYSKDREKDIVVDVSIELWPPGAENYSLLIVIECKNLGSSVPVDDAEEFKAKLDQIGGKNTKGIMVARRAFQDGTLKYAKNQGIGLARIMPSNQVSWLMHMVTNNTSLQQNNPNDVVAALTSESYRAKDCDFFSVYEDHGIFSWIDLIKHVSEN